MQETRLERLFEHALTDLDPGLTLTVLGPAHYPDSFWVELTHERRQAVWLSVGWPKQVREVLARPDRPDIVAARQLSPGAKELLDAADVSWFDATGAARVKLPGLLMRLDPKEKTVVARADLGWTPSVLAVSEALLGGARGSVSALVGATRMSSSTAAAALKFLQEQEFLEAEEARGPRARRRINRRDDLLFAYAAAAERLRPPTSVRVGTLWRDPARDCAVVGERWTARGIAWSATGALAADVLAPYLTDVAPLEIYVKARDRAELRMVGLEAGLKEVGGGRLLLRPFPTPAGDALSSMSRGVRVMPWPRVYADLRTTGVRGEEAADHLLDRVARNSQNDDDE